MPALMAGQAFPKTNVDQLGGGTMTLGSPSGDLDWQLVIVYRGLHCPLCKRYLGQLKDLTETFNGLGVEIAVVSGDGQDKAQKMREETGYDGAIGYGLSVAQMAGLGLYVSDPRSPQETDQPFPEPGLFVVNGKGHIQILDVSNAPFARPDLEMIANGIKFVRENDYPVRGMRQPA